jgi:phage shock protein C
MSTSTSHIEQSVSISEKELQHTLQDFLEENEKKPAPGIWNIRTITGLAMIFTAFAFIGHFVASEVFGLASLPFVGGLIQFMPYLGGALLAITLLSALRRSGSREKQKEREEEERVKETYDKLDQFLYSEKEKKRSAASGKGSFRKSISAIEAENRLMRSRTDSKIAGVCGGLAKYMGMSSTLARILFVIAFFMSSGTAILAYIALAIVMPKEPVSLMDDFN